MSASNGIPVILNCRAGGQAVNDMTERLSVLFKEAKLPAALIVAGEHQDLSRVVQRALAARPAMIVAAGGDGTINAVASEVVGTDTILGVLPMGTLNHFARDLHIPTGLSEAIATLGSGTTARIDVGEVNGRIFLNNSSLGLYPSLVHHREQQQMRLGRGKWRALLWSALLLLRHYPLLTVRVRVDNTDFTCRTPLVFVGNNEYRMQGLDIGIRERIDEGVLSLYIPRREGRFGLFRIAFRALFKRLRRSDDFEALRAGEFTIDTRRRQVRIATDGEVNMTATPVRYRIRPGALLVRVPRTA